MPNIGNEPNTEKVIYVGVAQFAKISGLSENTVRKLCIEQKIHNMRINRNYRINCEEALKDLKNMENFKPNEQAYTKDYKKMLKNL